MSGRRLAAVLGFVAAALALVAALVMYSRRGEIVQETGHAKAPWLSILQIRPTKWTGDFDVLLKHRMIRMLVSYSPTLFYHDHGRARGIIAEAGAELEKYLNKKYPDKRPFTVVLIPTTRDRLLQGLVDGEGDAAAGSLTITSARLKRFDFTTPTFSNVNQIFVTGPGAPELHSIDDLAGQTIHVRRSKSFYEHLLELNQRFENSNPKRPLPPMRLELLPDELESEDVLDMVNVGLVRIAVCEEWLADIWSKHLPNVRVRRDLVLREATQLGWAMRKQSPKLKAVLDEFVTRGRAQGLFQGLLRGAAVNVRRMQDATGGNEMKKFEATISLFRKYAKEYQFDYLMLAAQGYQESRLDQNAKSHVGAIGIMQVMPATGAEMKVGDIRHAAPNVHAGTKYMARLIDRYFKDAKFDEQNRNLFAFASYNAGPRNISKVRARAKKEGVNPDVWFNQVEHVAARMLGEEPVRYVRNVFKYYVAYKLAQQTEAERAEAIERLKSEAKDAAQDDEDDRR
jgi:membrane-bound lytic murein transglycosylase MltF